jgi:peptide/nickel transport system ATP-binding protein
MTAAQTETGAGDKTKKVLLRLDGVKMHFPLKKTSLLQKERPRVKAVDGVTIDIYEGETFGLVGESGCGKSTLGRVILQLYNQTAGSVRYSGVTLSGYAPAYAFRDAAKITSVKGAPEEMAAKFPELARIAGGLMLSDDLTAVAAALRANLFAVKEVYRLKTAIYLLDLKRAAYLESDEIMRSSRDLAERASTGNLSDEEKNKTRTISLLPKSIKDKMPVTPNILIDTKRRAVHIETASKKGLAKIEKKIADFGVDLIKAEELRDKYDKSLEELRKPCSGKPGYDMLENMRDVSVDLSRLKKEEMRRLRRDLQIIFQDPYSSLNQRFSVGQLISEALVAHKMYGRGTKQLEEYTLGVMEKCGLQNYFLHRYPHQFSGGQRQRIGIARALALQPRFVVCDEAVSALDVSIQSQIINLLIDLKEQSNLTYLFISHDLSTVKFISDRVAVMYLGNIVEMGDSDSIFAEPLHPYTNLLLEAIPTTDEASKKELQIIEGDIPSPINPPPGCKFHTRCNRAQDMCKNQPPEWREFLPKHWVACHNPVQK